MKEINNPHDKFFKQTLQDKETAKDFFKNYLPETLLSEIDLESLSLSKDSFVEKELEEVFSDILFEVKLNDKKSYFYLLFEHKSYSYKKVSFQLLKYMLQIWELHSSGKSKSVKKDKYPIIIPMVFYHGEKKWNIGLKLSDLLDEIPDEFTRYIPDYEYILYDLSQYKDEEIKGEIKLRLFLEVTKYIFSDKFIDKLKEILTIADELRQKETGMEYFETFLRYIMSARENLDEKKLVQIAQEISEEEGDNIMTLAEELRNEGMKKGISKGISKGVLKGLIEGIETIIDIKFGQVGLKLMGKIKKVSSYEKLKEIKEALRRASKLEEIEVLLP